MEFLQSHQVNFMLFMSGITAFITLLVFLTNTLPRPRRIALFLMELGATLLLWADRLAYIYRGQSGKLAFYMVRITNFSVFFFSIFLLSAFSLYLIDLFKTQSELKKPPKRLYYTIRLSELGTFLLVLSQFTNFYYYFYETNHYVRGKGFLLCYAVPFAIMAIQASAIIQHRKHLSPSLFVSMLLVPLLPFLATIVQIFAYGLSLTNMSLVFAIGLFYVFVIIDMNAQLASANKREIEILKQEQKHIDIMFSQTAEALASAIDAKDKYTHGHSARVADYARAIAKEAGKSEAECREIYFAALLHDVGKIGIPDNIINKATNLTDKEYAIIKSHTIIGMKILSNISQSPKIKFGAHYHHERYDGKGYPEGLKGEEIPEIARIIAVADTFDAMTSKRSYRNPLPLETAREQIEKGIGFQFDPTYATILLQLIDKDILGKNQAIMQTTA